MFSNLNTFEVRCGYLGGKVLPINFEIPFFCNFLGPSGDPFFLLSQNLVVLSGHTRSLFTVFAAPSNVPVHWKA